MDVKIDKRKRGGRDKSNKKQIGLSFSPYFIRKMEQVIKEYNFASRVEFLEAAGNQLIERLREEDGHANH